MVAGLRNLKNFVILTPNLPQDIKNTKPSAILSIITIHTTVLLRVENAAISSFLYLKLKRKFDKR